MNDDTLNKALKEFAKSLKINSIVFPNEQSIAATKEFVELLKEVGAKIQPFESKDAVPSSIKEAFKALSLSIGNLGELPIFESGNNALKQALVGLQADTVLRLSESYETPMIAELKKSAINLSFDGAIETINRTLKQSCIGAADVAFIKNAKLTEVFKDELLYPKGFRTSLDKLNKATATEIAANGLLKYDSNSHQFITDKGQTDSKGLNIICSAKGILRDSQEELFTEVELVDFSSFLSANPMVGATSDVGKRIYEFLQYLFRSQTQNTYLENQMYYHARSHKQDEMPFTSEQMMKAPHGLPWAGRYNQVGMSHYYFADTRSGAETEVNKHKKKGEVVQTAKMKPNERMLPVLLDLSGTLARGATFLRYLRFSLSDNTDKMPREYLIPCYVADCCKAIGFDGIKYYGSREYNNYVTWSDGYLKFVGMCG